MASAQFEASFKNSYRYSQTVIGGIGGYFTSTTSPARVVCQLQDTATDSANNQSTLTLTINTYNNNSSAFTINSVQKANWTAVVDGQSFSGTLSGTNATATKTGIIVKHNQDGSKTVPFSCQVIWEGVAGRIGVVPPLVYYDFKATENFEVQNPFGGTITITATTIMTSTNTQSNLVLGATDRSSSITVNPLSFDAGGQTIVTATPNFAGVEHRLYWNPANRGESLRASEPSSTGQPWNYTFVSDLATDSTYITNGTSFTGVFRLETYSGGILLGSREQIVTVNIPNNVVPTITHIQANDTSTTKPANGLYNATWIQGYSQPLVTITATGTYGSSITSYGAQIELQQRTGNPSQFGTINGSGNISINATVTDSRGRVGNNSTTIPVAEYWQPRMTYPNVERSSDGTQFICSISWDFARVNGINRGTMGINWRKSGSSGAETANFYADLAEPINLSNQQTNVQGVDPNSYYEVRYFVTDHFRTVFSSWITVNTGFILMDFLSSGLGMGIGTQARYGNQLAIDNMEIDVGDHFGVNRSPLRWKGAAIGGIDSFGNGNFNETVDNSEAWISGGTNNPFGSSGCWLITRNIHNVNLWQIAVKHSGTGLLEMQARSGTYPNNWGAWVRFATSAVGRQVRKSFANNFDGVELEEVASQMYFHIDSTCPTISANVKTLMGTFTDFVLTHNIYASGMTTTGECIGLIDFDYQTGELHFTPNRNVNGEALLCTMSGIMAPEVDDVESVYDGSQVVSPTTPPIVDEENFVYGEPTS